MSFVNRTRRAVAVTALAAATVAGSVVVPATGASAAACSDVDLVFARGSGEPQGPSVLQQSMLDGLTSGLGGRTVSSYSVVYGAGFIQDPQPGADDAIQHITTVARECPRTSFVLGGYSQGGSIVDLLLGVNPFAGWGMPGSATGLPAPLRDRVAAAVTFGNPLGHGLLAGLAKSYRGRVKEFCVWGDPACLNGLFWPAHLFYIFDGDTTAAGRWAAAKVLGGRGAPAAKPVSR